MKLRFQTEKGMVISMEDFFGKHNITKKKTAVFVTAMLLFIIIVAFRLSLVFVNMTADVYFLAGSLNQDILVLILNMLLIVCTVIMAFLILKRKAFKISLLFLGAAVMITNFYMFVFSYAIPEYVSFVSPDKKVTVIAEERSWFWGGKAVFYKKGILFSKRLKTASTGEGYRPFSNYDYSVKWEGRTIIINYGIGQGDKREEVKIDVK